MTEADSPLIDFMDRLARVSGWAIGLTPILYGTAPKDPYEWMAIPFVMKLLLLWTGDELRWLFPFAAGKEEYKIQGLIPPPPDALDRIERLQTALRTPYVTEEELTPEQVALAKDMLAIVEPPPTP
jgi:hypothetical protein